MSRPSNASLPDPGPFPWLSMISMSVALLSHGVAMTSLFSYVGFLVADLGVAADKDAAGFSAGYVTSAFMAGRVLSSFFWGSISDRIGRKPVLYVSLLALAIFSVMFGLARTFAAAIAARFLIGLFNGIIAVCRTAISEVCGPHHEIQGVGFLTGSWSVSFVLGPAVGGLLARPAEQYPNHFAADGILGRFPYLLPNLLAAALAVVSIPCIFFFMPETAWAGSNRGRKKGFEAVPQRDYEEQLRPTAAAAAAHGSGPGLGGVGGFKKPGDVESEVGGGAGGVSGSGGDGGDKGSSSGNGDADWLAARTDGKVDTLRRCNFEGHLNARADPATDETRGRTLWHHYSGRCLEDFDDGNVAMVVKGCAGVEHAGQLVHRSRCDDSVEAGLLEGPPSRSPPQLLPTGRLLLERGATAAPSPHGSSSAAAAAVAASSAAVATAAAARGKRFDGSASITSTEGRTGGGADKSSGGVDSDGGGGSDGGGDDVARATCRVFGLCGCGIVPQLLGESLRRWVLAIYMLFSFFSIMFDEVLPLWCITSVSRGGLGWQTGDIGQVLSVAGLFLVFFQFVVFPIFTRRVGAVRAIEISIMAQVPLFFAFPVLSRLKGGDEELQAALVAFVVGLKSLSNVVFASLTLCTNNSVSRSMRGSFNGLMMTVGSIAKSLGPPAGAVLYAYSVADGAQWPFDYHLVFYVLAVLIGAIGLLVAWQLPAEMLMSADRDKLAADEEDFQLRDAERPRREQQRRVERRVEQHPCSEEAEALASTGVSWSEGAGRPGGDGDDDRPMAVQREKEIEMV
ncbi:unnamed protein product [Phaeothamnion confervicola]